MFEGGGGARQAESKNLGELSGEEGAAFKKKGKSAAERRRGSSPGYAKRDPVRCTCGQAFLR